MTARRRGRPLGSGRKPPKDKLTVWVDAQLDKDIDRSLKQSAYRITRSSWCAQAIERQVREDLVSLAEGRLPKMPTANLGAPPRANRKRSLPRGHAIGLVIPPEVASSIDRLARKMIGADHASRSWYARRAFYLQSRTTGETTDLSREQAR